MKLIFGLTSLFVASGALAADLTTTYYCQNTNPLVAGGGTEVIVEGKTAKIYTFSPSFERTLLATSTNKDDEIYYFQVSDVKYTFYKTFPEKAGALVHENNGKYIADPLQVCVTNP